MKSTAIKAILLLVKLEFREAMAILYERNPMKAPTCEGEKKLSEN